jgi:hypothetical protein
LVEKRVLIHYIYNGIWRETMELLHVTWQIFSLAQIGYKQDSNRRWLTMRDLVVWDWYPNYLSAKVIYVVTDMRKNGYTIFYVNRNFQYLHSNIPVRIWIRIDPPHSLVCRNRRLNGEVLRMRPEKQRSHVTAGVAR